MKGKNRIFKLFESCRCVKGHARSIIYDLKRYDYDFISNSLYEFIQKSNNKKLDISSYNKEEKNLLEDYISFLIEKDYIFFCDDEKELSMFPELSLEWDFPSYLTSTIVEIGDYWTEKEIILILDSLREVNCFHFQIYSSSIQRLEFYDIFLKKANKYPFRSIELVIPYYLDIEKDIEAFTSKNCILKHVLIYNSPMEKIISNSGTEDKCFFINQNLNLAGYIDYGYFQVNIDLFSESQKHHTFFNRKAIITKDLNVKNHLLQQEVFGNLKEQSLYQIINRQDFQEFWFVHKENIDVCKDCELRHMCIDPRVPHKRNDNSWYHEDECNYNPYIAKWVGEPNYLTLEQSGIISNNKVSYIDYQKLNDVFSMLYGFE